MSETYLITGGAGFIGSHLADRLLHEGHSVRVLDNLSTGDIRNLDDAMPHIEFVEGDLRDRNAVRRAVSGVDVVVHLGALGSVPRSVEDPSTSHDVNATGTLNVAVAARDASCRRVVFSSSSSVYGDNPTLPKVEGQEGKVLSPYAVTKAMGEEYLRLAHDLYGLDTVRLRFFNVFGPRQKADHVYAAVIPKFIDRAKRALPLQIHGDGTQSRDFTYIDNNVDGILLAASTRDPRAPGNVFNLACGGNLTLLEIVAEIETVAGSSLAVEYGPSRPGDIPHSHASIDALHEMTGYKPVVTVEEGIRLTWDAYGDERAKT